MNEKFLKLKQSKQQKILNAAIKEFAEKGYDGASTDRIVQQAGISKGSLFGYFGNKRVLYLDVLREIVEEAKEYMEQHLYNSETKDFYEALESVVDAKYQFLMDYKEKSKLLIALMQDKNENMPEKQEVQKEYLNVQEDILKNKLLPCLEEMDLKEGVNKEDVVGITYIVLDALSKQDMYMKKIGIGQEDRQKEQIKKYLYILRHGVCK